MTFSKRLFTRSLWLLLLSLASVSAFAVDCNTSGFACTNLDTQIKGSRLPMWGTDSGSANAYAITTIAPLGPSLRTGSRLMFVATHANTTASTLVVDGGSTIAIKKNVSAALAAGDIALNQVIEVTYDGTNFQIVGNGALSFSNLSGSLACSQMPALTGDVTSSAGSCATTLATVTVPKGGTGQTTLTAHNFVLGEGASAVAFLSLAAHQVPVGATSADPSGKTVPDCQDTSGNHLNFTQSTDAFSCGTSSSGAGGGGGSGPALSAVYCDTPSFSCGTRFNVIANQLIVAACNYFTNGAGAGTPSFSDTLSLTWTQISTVFQAGQSRGVTTWWANPGSTTGADTFTCGETVTMSFGGMGVVLIGGATLAGPIDATATATGNNVSYNQLITTTSDNDLLIMSAEYGGSFTAFTGDQSYLPAFWEALYVDGGAADIVLARQAGKAGKYYLQGTFNGNHAFQLIAIK